MEEALSRLVKVFYRSSDCRGVDLCGMLQEGQGREQVMRLDTMTSDLQ